MFIRWLLWVNSLSLLGASALFARENVDPNSPLSALGAEVDFQITANIPITHNVTTVNFRAGEISEGLITIEEPVFFCRMALKTAYSENITIRASALHLDAVTVSTTSLDMPAVRTNVYKRTRVITFRLTSSRISLFSCWQVDLVESTSHRSDELDNLRNEDLFKKYGRKVQDIYDAFGSYVKLNLNNPVEVEP